MKADKAVSKSQVLTAVDTILNYCSTFREDNRHREKLLKEGKLIQAKGGLRESKAQLANHYRQKHAIDIVEKMVSEIISVMERITYRG